jgi:hypothetical protein
MTHQKRHRDPITPEERLLVMRLLGRVFELRHSEGLLPRATHWPAPLRGREEREARRALARLLRSGYPLEGEGLSGALADWLDRDGGRPRQDRKHLLIALYMRHAIDGGASVTAAVKAAADEYGFQDTRQVRKIWARYRLRV